MKFLDVALSSWAPEANRVLHRAAPRHPLDRSWNYEDRFDFFTIIYDVFWSDDGQSVILICPPPMNLQAPIFDGDFRAMPSGAKAEPSLLCTGPINIITIPVPDGTQAIRLECEVGVYFLTPQPNLSGELADQRLIVTISKNNELSWIRDWMYFHVKMHGCTGLIFYDNGSDRYTIYEVAEALKEIPGLDYAVLMSTPFPYGVNNGPFGVNDSRFFTRGALEHAKYRLARRAAGLMHIDVDELVVSPQRANVFEAVEQSSTGYISFEGIWVERVTESGLELPADTLSHSAFKYIGIGGGRSSLRKTAIAPSRVDPKVYMTTHRAYGANPDYARGDLFKHRHFIGLKTISTNIKNKERLDREPFQAFDPALHEVDTALAEQLRACFDSEEYHALVNRSHGNKADPDVVRRLGGIAFAKGNFAEAAELTRQAIAARSDYPSYYQFLARCLDLLGLSEEAADATRKAKDLLSGSPEVRIASIKELRRNRDFEKALVAATDLVSEFPDRAEVHHERGEVLSRMGDRDAAEIEFRKAVELDSNSPRLLWRWASQLYRSRDYEEATAAFQRLLDHPESGFSDRARAYQGLRHCLEGLDRLEEALALSRAALGALGRHAKMTTAMRSDFEGAIVRLEHELDPKGPAVLNGEAGARVESAKRPRLNREERLKRREAGEERRALREERRVRQQQRLADREAAQAAKPL